MEAHKDPCLLPPIPEARLKAVQVIFRHGARTPLTKRFWGGVQWDDCGVAFPKTPMHVFNLKDGHLQPEAIDNAAMQYEGGCTRGELTLTGQLQALELGCWLRQRYQTLFPLVPSTYDPAVVQARTTNWRRTRDTMHGVLTGLFPDTAASGGHFTVHSSTRLEETMLAQVSTCATLGNWHTASKELMASKVQSDPHCVAADKVLSKRLGLDGESGKVGYSELHDAITSLAAHGKPLPLPFTPAELDAINIRATRLIVGRLTDAADANILSLTLGRLLTQMQDLLDVAATAPNCNDAPAPLMLWSGHDTTVIPMLVMLGHRIERWPPYASSVVFELWEDTSAVRANEPPDRRHHIRVLFNKMPLPVGPRGKSCMTLEEFKRDVTSGYTLSNREYDRRCMATHKAAMPHVDTSSY